MSSKAKASSFKVLRLGSCDFYSYLGMSLRLIKQLAKYQNLEEHSREQEIMMLWDQRLGIRFLSQT